MQGEENLAQDFDFDAPMAPMPLEESAPVISTEASIGESAGEKTEEGPTDLPSLDTPLDLAPASALDPITDATVDVAIDSTGDLVSDPNSDPNLASIPTFSESAPAAEPAPGPAPGPEWVPAAFPFHLKLFGFLNDLQREELLTLITDLRLGLSEQDLKLQLEMGRVFLPQISEPVGVFLLQKTRSWGLRWSFEPVSREATQKESMEVSHEVSHEVSGETPVQHAPPRRSVPLLTDVPGDSSSETIGLVQASVVVSMEDYLDTRSSGLRRAWEFLQLEITRQATGLGAACVREYRTESEVLPLYRGVRLMARGIAARESASKRRIEEGRTPQ